MRRAIPWLAAIFFVGCLALGTFVHEQKLEISRADLARKTAESEAKTRIAVLEHQVAALESVKVQTDKQISLSADGVSPSESPQGDHPDGGPKIVHISDIIKDHPEYAAPST
jgi:hypothetical protein